MISAFEIYECFSDGPCRIDTEAQVPSDHCLEKEMISKINAVREAVLLQVYWLRLCHSAELVSIYIVVRLVVLSAVFENFDLFVDVPALTLFQQRVLMIDSLSNLLVYAELDTELLSSYPLPLSNSSICPDPGGDSTILISPFDLLKTTWPCCYSLKSSWATCLMV